MIPDGDAWKTAAHEGSHLATAVLIGWEVTGASRLRHGDYTGVTFVTPRTDGDVVQRAIELAEIVISPFVQGSSGLKHDFDVLSRLDENHISIAEAKRRVEKLIRTDRHFQLRWLSVDAMMSKPELDEDDVRRLIERVDHLH